MAEEQDWKPVCCVGCQKDVDPPYIVACREGRDGPKYLCIKCTLEEALNFALERGYTPGCATKGFETAKDVKLYYEMEELTDHFSGGWADIA